jgi:hypothetical protein
MTILYDYSRPIKIARLLGAGILASRPNYQADHTSADEAWLVQDNAARSGLDRHVDEMAEEFAAIARLEMGLCC